MSRWWGDRFMMMLKILQINLHHCKAASAALLLKIQAEDVDLVLIQEPWVSGDRVLGLRAPNYKVKHAKKEGKIRSCILAKNNLNVFVLFNYSNSDVVAVGIEIGSLNLWLISAYLPYDDDEIAPAILRGALMEAQKRKVGVILGCDANSHHTIWGSTDTNVRGELLLDFILSTNLQLCNIGCKPTFITSNRQEVLDITLVSDFIKDRLMNWKVSDDHSFSDHCYLQYEVVTETTGKVIFRNRKKTDWNTFRTTLGNSLPVPIPKPPVSIQELDVLVDNLSDAFKVAMIEASPLSRPLGKPRPPWWSKQLQSSRQNCKRLFKKAKRTRTAEDWDSYKEVLRIYKYEIRSAKISAWRLFCGKIQESSEAARLRKVLAASPTILSHLQRPDGSWTTTSTESLELLLKTHFPECSESAPVMPSAIRGSGVVGQIISRRKIVWAINSFKPYRSAGPDGIIPADVQQSIDLALPWLEVIFRGSLELGHIPRKWSEVNVIFIPKAGKSSHCHPKDLRPISLCSFLLKVLERQVEAHIRGSIEPVRWSKSQHAYCKGRSVETALHSLIYPIEKSLGFKEYSMVTFLDIEGAFSNVKPEAITRALASLGVDESLNGWIDQMLRCRIVTAKLGGSSISRFVGVGTPQGGVLSPLLWNLVINGLLLELEGQGFRVVAYADDVAIGVYGKYPVTIRERMQSALCILSNWANSCGLKINPQKTEVVLFSRKYKLPQIDPPVLNGISLTFTDKAKYLGLILDRKLSWKPNIAERVKKATIALYSCKNAIGKRWGLEPHIVYWLYTSVVRPILLYGIVVWWPALSSMANQRLLMKVQRTSALCISGALRSTPTQALETLFHLLPLDILGIQMAASTAIRLKSISMWTCNSTGHSSILRNRDIPDTTDYMIPSPSFEERFHTNIPSREDWLSEEMLKPEVLNFFTDGSKMDGKVGGGVFCDKLNVNLSFRLPDYCSVFQAELIAIMEAVDWLRYNVISTKDIRIFTDSQAAIKTLRSYFLTSKVAQNCLSSLNEMADQFNIQLIWVPGHFNIAGNEKADELARQGTECLTLLSKVKVDIPLASCKLLLQEEARRAANIRWSNGTSCHITRQIWPKLDLSRTRQLLTLRRCHISMVVGVVTGHCLIGEHARRLGVSSNDYCRSCEDEEEEETVLHLLCTCPRLAQSRWKFLGAPLLRDLEDLNEMDVRGIQRFVLSSGWFKE